MTLTRWISAVIFGVLLAMAAGAAGGIVESVSSLLEKAIYYEQTSGDLDAAMGTFRKVAADGQATRRQAAQAQYHLGLCQLKKQQPDAAAQTFRTVSVQYADQKDIAQQAGKQLAAAGNGNGGGGGSTGGGNSGNGSQMQKRPIGKAVAIFPEQVDLSTPEGELSPGTARPARWMPRPWPA